MENIKCAHTKIEDIHKLVPNPRNTNNHPERQIEMYAKILDFQGQRVPITVSNRSKFMTKGHGCLLAAQKLGWTKVAVDYQDYESEAQEYADLEADNMLAQLAEHDESMMIDNIKDLGLDDFELLGLDGFDVDLNNDLDLEKEIKDIEDESRHTLIVECISEIQLQEIYEYLLKKDIKCKIME